jgi:hypothetical protein
VATSSPIAKGVFDRHKVGSNIARPSEARTRGVCWSCVNTVLVVGVVESVLRALMVPMRLAQRLKSATRRRLLVIAKQQSSNQTLLATKTS